MKARVIDYETTGVQDDEAAEVIEFGRIDVDLETLELSNAWTSLAKPIGPIPPQTKAVHHITEDDVAFADPAAIVWPRFWAGKNPDDILVAHNAKFEQHFTPGEHIWIDTLKVASVVWPDAPGHSNQCLRYWLELDADNEQAFPPHRALPDAYVTALLFIRLLAEKSVDEMITISGYPVVKNKITFGKDHKGKRYTEAPEDYLEWIRDKSSMDEDTKFSARYWLQKMRQK